MDKDKYNYDLYKELYYHEFEMKDKIDNRANFAFGILTILIGTIIFFYDKYLFYINTKISSFLSIGLLILLICIIISIFCVFKSYYGYSYDYIPPANSIFESLTEFEKYYHEHKEYFDEIGEEEESVINKAIERNMNIILRNSATKNRGENIKKIKWLRRFSWLVLITLFILAFNFGIIMYGDMIIQRNPEQKTTIEVFKGGE